MATAEIEFPIQISLPRAELEAMFTNEREIVRWLEEERRFLTNLSSNGVTNLASINVSRSQLDNIANVLSGWQQNRETNELKETITGTFRAAYERHLLVYSGSSQGKFLSNLIGKFPKSGRTALDVFMGHQHSDPNQSTERIGAIAAYNFLLGIEGVADPELEALSVAKAAHAATRRELATKMEEILRDFQTRWKNFDAAIEDKNEKLTVQYRNVTQEFVEFRDGNIKKLKEHFERINQEWTEAKRRYEVELATASPVQY